MCKPLHLSLVNLRGGALPASTIAFVSHGSSSEYLNSTFGIRTAVTLRTAYIFREIRRFLGDGRIPQTIDCHFEKVRWGERTGRIVLEFNGTNHRTSTSLPSDCGPFGSCRPSAATRRKHFRFLRSRGGYPRKKRFLSWGPCNPESGEPADHAGGLRVHDRGVRSPAGPCRFEP